ncbi:MAG: 3D domain-containing protein [Candidatus Sungbacteria bacterium]|nr:3D domain-containing protein [Candidatus Sungbacteria bacterium]
MEPKADIRKLKITAYSSSHDETDDTPDVTASGTKTRPGVVAANFLPFGTKVRIPQLFGDRVFTVEDRMHSRFQDRLDIWFPTKQEARRFGLQFTEVEIEI